MHVLSHALMQGLLSTASALRPLARFTKSLTTQQPSSSSSSAKESSDGFARRGAADGFVASWGGGRRDPPASAMGAGRARGAVAATGAGSAASRARSDEQTASSGATTGAPWSPWPPGGAKPGSVRLADAGAGASTPSMRAAVPLCVYTPASLVVALSQPSSFPGTACRRPGVAPLYRFPSPPTCPSSGPSCPRGGSQVWSQAIVRPRVRARAVQCSCAQRRRARAVLSTQMYVAAHVASCTRSAGRELVPIQLGDGRQRCFCFCRQAASTRGLENVAHGLVAALRLGCASDHRRFLHVRH